MRNQIEKDSTGCPTGTTDTPESTDKANATLGPRNTDDTTNRTSNTTNPRQTSNIRQTKAPRWAILLVLLAVGIAIPVTIILTSIKEEETGSPSFGNVNSSSTMAQNEVDYKCPTPLDPDANIAKAIATNATEFLASYKANSKHIWDRTYRELKASLQDFTSSYFAKYLNDGSSIYQSGLGIGLNLFLTLEILQESSAGIQNLIVYGSDQREQAVRELEAVMDKLGPAHSENGAFCLANPTDLGFVPKESFDIVYTGYIRPLKDPLNFGFNRTDFYDKYQQLCKAVDWEGQQLRDQAQEVQEQWYGENVREMARLAKPGSPVIVEQVSPRNCDTSFDWGGVSQEWWATSARDNTYGWDINPDSVVIEVATLYVDRYHVFMLKNGAQLE